MIPYRDGNAPPNALEARGKPARLRSRVKAATSRTLLLNRKQSQAPNFCYSTVRPKHQDTTFRLRKASNVFTFSHRARSTSIAMADNKKQAPVSFDDIIKAGAYLNCAVATQGS